MKCFNCGDEADMEIVMMINGNMKKISICMECYREQTQHMMDMMSDENGNIDPFKIQQQMNEFLQNNPGEIERMFNEMSKFGEIDADIDYNDVFLNREDEVFEEPRYDERVFDNDIFGNFNIKRSEMSENFDYPNFERRDRNNPYRNFNIENTNENYSNKSHAERQIQILQRSIRKKQKELNNYVKIENYMSAANSRDEIREMNKKIMIMKRLAKEGEIK